MPTRRQHFDTTFELMSDFLLAAEDRFQDGEAMIFAGNFDGGLYLLGYAAEMWLKVASMRLQNLGPADQVKGALGPIKTWMSANAPAIAFTNNHNLGYFAEFIVARRRQLQRPLPSTLAGELRLRITLGLFEDWTINMRYRRSGVAATEARVAWADAWWLRQNWQSLT